MSTASRPAAVAERTPPAAAGSLAPGAGAAEAAVPDSAASRGGAALRDSALAGAAVAVRGVSKAFGYAGDRVWALDNVSLEIGQGEFVCVVGASGCGKSTLLNLIAGLEQPTAGTIQRREGEAALMFQETALFPWLTVQRNVELALRLRGVGKAARRQQAGDLLALVNLEEFAGKRPHELSGGMRSRVALARALAQERRVLLMDEPFGALDAITRDLLHDELERLWRESGLAVVFVTHNVREAVRLGDRVVLLSSRPGRVAEEFRVELPRPRLPNTPELAGYATAITNRLRGEVRRHGGDPVR